MSVVEVMNAPDSSAAQRLNRECFCIGTDVAALHRWIDEWLSNEFRSRGLPPMTESHPHLFSALPVFVSRAHVLEMARVIRDVETVIGSAPFQETVLGGAPDVARRAPRAHGVLQGYDFHLGADGPNLIEINTNAGGAMLNATLGRAQRACCTEVADLVSGACDFAALDERLFGMFATEWHRARGNAPLERIAIVDADPATQYLYPEFVMFRKLFEAHGIAAAIADPRELDWRGGVLLHGGERIDLVYNRLTDFYFETEATLALRRAYEHDAVVVTPHPHAHALYANKRNLTLLSDAAVLRRWGIREPIVETLVRAIPRTVAVRAEDAQTLWAERKRLFFKPACGFGSRGSYRGEKLTRKVFADILGGDYVAQSLVPPSERLAEDGTLKVDLRNYVHDGEVALIAARLYQGQTTNFRTPGGGFAPVFYPTDSGSCGVIANSPLSCQGSLNASNTLPGN